MPVPWERVEREVGSSGNYLEVYDSIPRMIEAIRECAAPFLVEQALSGEITSGSVNKEFRWRTMLLAWFRMKFLQKMEDPTFLKTVYGHPVAAYLRNEEKKTDQEIKRAMADGIAEAVLEIVLDDILRIK